MPYKIRVMGSHRPLRGSPVVVWSYRAEAVDPDDRFQPPAWSCEHLHETPQLAQTCGEQWLRLRLNQEQAAS